MPLPFNTQYLSHLTAVLTAFIEICPPTSPLSTGGVHAHCKYPSPSISYGNQAQSDGSKLRSSISDLGHYAYGPLSRLLTQVLALASHRQDLEAGQATQVVVLRL